jgi:hypothetical protein
LENSPDFFYTWLQVSVQQLRTEQTFYLPAKYSSKRAVFFIK